MDFIFYIKVFIFNIDYYSSNFVYEKFKYLFLYIIN